MPANNSLPASLVDRFRQDIVNGVYMPRERLVEAELAVRYGVNRSAMRAALIELSAEGLVEREPQRGARVRALTLKEGIEIGQVRRELECLCARLAAERASPAEREQLRELVEDLREAYDQRDMPRYMAANSRFHTTILEIARHEIAQDIVTRLGNLNFQRHFPMAFTSPVPAASDEEHGRIAQAIIDGDGDAAAAVMYEHLDATIRALQAQLEADGTAAVGAGAALR